VNNRPPIAPVTAGATGTSAEWLRDTGRIDLLVNNAGFAMVAGAEESSETQVRAIFEINVFGAMRVARAVLPTMRDQSAGRIVNISSVVGFLPAPFSTLYAASKHALEGWSESLDHEVRALGVRSILICPAGERAIWRYSSEQDGITSTATGRPPVRDARSKHSAQRAIIGASAAENTRQYWKQWKSAWRGCQTLHASAGRPPSTSSAR
jgi:short-subunit dehydrogenase